MQHSKRNFWETEGRLIMFGLNFTNDEQISNWVNRAEETWRSKVSNFSWRLHANQWQQAAIQFLKSLDIANINAEVENLHPSTHEFWENATIKKKHMDFKKAFRKIRKHTKNKLFVKLMHLQNISEETMMKLKWDLWMVYSKCIN